MDIVSTMRATFGRSASWFEGWRLFFLLALAESGACLWLLGAGGEPGISSVIRNSARFSEVLFAAAFAASPLVALARSPGTLWLRRNRRYTGVAFAWSHTIHLAAIAFLVISSEQFASELDPVTLLGGGTAYVFVYLMAFTSSDAAQRALGMRNWQRLHRVGSWILWVVFAETLTSGVVFGAWSRLPGAILLWAVFALRVAAWRRRRKSAQSRGQQEGAIHAT